MTAVIFGASGQDGHYLRKLLERKGIECHKISRPVEDSEVDISNFDSVNSLIKNHKPEYVFHLAATSSLKHSFILENQKTIVDGTLNILESVRQNSCNTKVFITGSGLQFKNSGKPISESDQFDRSSAYALSRIQSVEIARYYRKLGLPVYVGYLFHHESPLRKGTNVSKEIVSAAKEIAQGKKDCLNIGSLAIRKEWTFAGDTVEAIMKLLEQESDFEAVIGTGVSYSIEDWINICFNLVNLDWRNHVKETGNFDSQFDCLVSNPKTINNLGWQPKVDFNSLARLMINSS